MMREDYDAVVQVRDIERQLLAVEQKAPEALASDLHQFGQKLAVLEGTGGGRRRGGGGTGMPSLSSLNAQLAQVFEVIQGSDNAPTTQALTAVATLQTRVQQQLAAWKQIQAADLVQINEKIRGANLPTIDARK
jgi:uncharacterized alpha-E superfamily protein